MSIRNLALILDIGHPLMGKPELINSVLQNMGIVTYWARFFPVSIKLLPSQITYLFMLGGGTAQ